MCKLSVAPCTHLLRIYIGDGDGDGDDDGDVEEVPAFRCSHEEADTRMILHAKFSQAPVVVHSDDTDVFISY